MKTKEEFVKYARGVQKIHFELLNGSSYDVIRREDLSKFVMILGHYLPKDTASKIYDKFIEKESELKYRILIINCNSDKGMFNVPVIRVLKNGRPVFFDGHCRKYENWEDFLSYNKLPECQMLYPENGSYIKENGQVKLGTKDSPSSSVLSQADKYIYVTAEIISVLSTAAPMFAFAKPYASAVKVASGLSNGYKVAHHSYHLFDRYQHGQSIDLRDEAARVHWSHIGNGFITFAMTCWRIEYCEPSREADWQNLIKLLTLCQKHFSENDGDITVTLNIIRGHILCQHMICFTGEATAFFQKHLKFLINSNREYDVSKLISALRSYLDKDYSSTFRQLINVGVDPLKKVAHNVQQCSEINNGLSTKVYDLLPETMDKVDSIMKEVHSWSCDNISGDQLQFRVTEICRGGKKYENTSEMCRYYKVKNIEDIIINGKKIFNDVGTGKCTLNDLVSASAKCFPQLLWYAVQYASAQDGNIDWEGFKKYFKDRICKEKLSNINQFREGRRNITWINSINFQEVRFSTNKTENFIELFKPRSNMDESICLQDLVNLGKKALGSFSVDFNVFEAEIKWVVLISKVKKMTVIIAPKTDMLDSLCGSYPVFVRAI